MVVNYRLIPKSNYNTYKILNTIPNPVIIYKP